MHLNICYRGVLDCDAKKYQVGTCGCLWCTDQLSSLILFIKKTHQRKYTFFSDPHSEVLLQNLAFMRTLFPGEEITIIMRILKSAILQNAPLIKFMIYTSEKAKYSYEAIH